MWLFYTPKRNQGWNLCLLYPGSVFWWLRQGNISFSPVKEYGPPFLIYFSPQCSEQEIFKFFIHQEVFSLGMKWTGSCGLIYFSFHQVDSFLSHITAIPLSTLVGESQVPLHSVQRTRKQFSLELAVTSCESSATIYRKTIILALDAVSEQHGNLTRDTTHSMESKKFPEDIMLWFYLARVWQGKRCIDIRSSRKGKACFGFVPQLFLACPLSEQDGTKQLIFHKYVLEEMGLPEPVTHPDRHSLTQFVNIQRAQTSADWSATNHHIKEPSPH